MSLKSTVRVYNILLLGTTGTGKSTLVNSIANYFTYETLEEALEANEPICVIPSSFDLTLANFKKIIITQYGINRADVGNENHSGASSCTQKPRVYSFYNDEVGFNVIDIPGIGDTRGMMQDATNKKIISDKIKEFTEIHGIFILFKASEPRLTPEIKYNLNETLMLLHASAVPNIMFVITNARGQDYGPGPAMNTLKEYVGDLYEKKKILIELNENTIFCVDNEAYKFQCGWNKSEEYRNEMKDLKGNYIKSWDFSRKVIFKLFEKMYTLSGHNVQLTSSVGQARTVIHCAIGPLATITGYIQRALTPASRQANIETLMNSGNQIKNEVEIEKTLPRTVCTSEKCIEAIKIPGTKRYNFNFKTVCHDKCYLRNVALAKFPEPALEDCQAFDIDGNCTHCGCRVERHMHLSQKQTQKQVLNKVAQKPLTKEEAEKFMDKFVKAQVKEQAAIINAIVKLSIYLKQNAILEYNNAFEERIMLEIRKEQAALSEGVEDSADVITKLQNTLKHYKDQMKAINVSIANGNASKVTEEEVQEVMTLLFTLPHNGANIRKMYEAESLDCKATPDMKNANPKEVFACCVKYLP
uniref:G domain-containing protein n=1 Tax=Panagrolaimus davidi TaxID=227884 RepID=A0A914PMT5_9BILA